jgi:hypothetical protein
MGSGFKRLPGFLISDVKSEIGLLHRVNTSDDDVSEFLLPPLQGRSQYLYIILTEWGGRLVSRFAFQNRII